MSFRCLSGSCSVSIRPLGHGPRTHDCTVFRCIQGLRQSESSNNPHETDRCRGSTMDNPLHLSILLQPDLPGSPSRNIVSKAFASLFDSPRLTPIPIVVQTFLRPTRCGRRVTRFPLRGRLCSDHFGRRLRQFAEASPKNTKQDVGIRTN